MVGSVKLALRLSVVSARRALFLVVLLTTGCTSANVAAPPPVDVTFVIPSGTELALERGEPAFQFPDEIQVPAGRSVVITNQDFAMHYFFDIPVAPGQTIRKPFGRAGEFVYQGGLSCSISRTNTIRVRVL
jgi:hypothetical protein